LPPIAVKLNGVIAATNPLRGLYFDVFLIPFVEIGCFATISLAKLALKFQKSASSHAASISASYKLFPCPKIVYAIICSRYFVLIKSAAFTNILLISL